MTAPDELLLANVRIGGRDGTVDVLLGNGSIVEIGEHLSSAAQMVDGAGALLLPALVDAHCHVDKTVWGSGRWLSHHAGGTLADRIAYNAAVREQWGIPRPDWTENLLRAFVARGTTAIRTHVDIDPAVGLRSVEVVAQAAAKVGPALKVQMVAFPQQGIVGKPEVAGLMREAAAMGVNVLGGLDPAGRERDPVEVLDITFGLAKQSGADIDLHLHDRGSLGVWEIEMICERTKAEGYEGKVVLSHVYCMGEVDAKEQDRLAGLLAGAGVGVITASPFNLPLPPLIRLAEAGVTVALGNDSIRNTWSPFGTADMLQRAMIAATRSSLREDEEISKMLSFATRGGRQMMRMDPPAIEVGAPADLFTVDAINEVDAVVSTPPRRLVFSSGALVARDGQMIERNQA